MRKLALALVCLLELALPAAAQTFPGLLQPGQVLGNYDGASAPGTPQNWMNSGSGAPSNLSAFQDYVDTAGGVTDDVRCTQFGSSCLPWMFGNQTAGIVGFSIANPSSVIGNTAIAQFGTMNLQYGSETCGQQLYQLFNPTNGFFANAQVCNTIPSGTAVHQHIAGLFSVLDEAGAGNALPLVAQCIEAVSGGDCWGLNSVHSDAPIEASCPSFSISGSTLTIPATGCTGTVAIGQRVIDNASQITAGTTITGGSGTSWTISTTASIPSGSTIAFHAGSLTSETLQDEIDFFVFGVSTRARVLFNGYFTQPPAATGINGDYQAAECNIFSTSLYPWEDCFVSQNGAAVYGLTIGTTVLGNPAATGELSQIVRFGYTDNTTGTTERYAELWADPTHAGSTGADLRLHATVGNFNLVFDNTAVLAALNAAGTADIAIASVDASNNIQFGAGGTSVFANEVNFSSTIGLNGAGTGTAGQVEQSAGASPAVWASLRNYYGSRISGVSTTSGFGTAIGSLAINTSSSNGVWVLSPASGTFKNLYVSLTSAPGAGQSVQVTLLVAGTSTSVTCTISGASATSCSDTTHTATISAGQTYNYQITVSSGNATETMAAGIEFDNP